jgi:preprotein translocase subunit SecA
VHLRAFAQKDPLVEYRGEGHAMFEELSAAIREEVVATLFHAQLAPEAAPALAQQPVAGDGSLSYEFETTAGQEAITAAGLGGAGGGGSVATAGAVAAPAQTVSTQTRVLPENQKLGRNDPCWCGSGKKYKKCHGA